MNKLEFFETNVELSSVVPHLAAGRNHSLENQLITKSRQPHVLRSTPNDAESRFTNRRALEKWFKQDRELFWLLSPSGDLAGIVWFGPKKFPLDIKLHENPTETFGLRLYDGYIGKRLSAPFFLQGLALATKRKHDRGEGVSALWGVTDTGNYAARSVYAHAGFRDVDQNASRVHMVLSANQINQIAADNTPKLVIKVGESTT